MLKNNSIKMRFGQDERYLKLVEKVYGFKQASDAEFPFSICHDRLVSSAFFEYGGITAEELNKREIKKRCDELLTKTGTKLIETHGGGAERGIFREQPLYQTAIKLLPDNQKALWESLSYEARKTVTQSEKFGVICHEASVREIKTVFYPLYCRWMKSFGSPVHPLAYFTYLKKYFGDDCRIVVAEREGEVLACLLGVVCGGVINLLSSPATVTAGRYRANDATHWYLLKEMVKQKLSWFDFGPVRYEGQRRFKVKWGVVLRPYSFWYYLKGEQPPPAHTDPDSPFYRVLRWVWKYLVPEWIANEVGPVIRKWLVV